MTHEWPMAPLGRILAKSDEWTVLKPEETYKEVTVRLWGKGVTLRREVAGTGIAAGSRIVVRTNQFILSRIDARNGAFGLITEELDGAVVSTDFPVFTVNESLILPIYLNWMSKTASFADLCKVASEGTTNRIRLKEDRFLATEIPLPTLDEQRRLVARIEALATKIEEARGLRRLAVEEAEALTKSAMREAFERESNTETVWLEDVCTEIIDNLHSNPVYSETGTVPTLRSPDVGWGKLFLGTALKTDEVEYKRRTVRGEPRPGDIVLVREGGGTGKAAMMEEGQRFSLGQRVMMIRPNQSRVVSKFFMYQLLSPAIYEDRILPLSKGSASPHLNIGTLRKFDFLLPPLEEQRRIVAYLDGLQGKVDALKALQAQTQAELDALLPSVLDKAFKGEL